MENKKKVLIVEDEISLLNALRDKLTREGLASTPFFGHFFSLSTG